MSQGIDRREIVEAVLGTEKEKGGIDVEGIVRERFYKNRRYISDPSDAPDDANVQEGARGGYYYEVGGSGGDGDSGVSIGDDATPEQMDRVTDTVSSVVDELGPKLRDDGMDVGFELIDEDPTQSVDEVNERVRTYMGDRIMDTVESELGVTLDGHTYDDATEAIYDEMEDYMADAEVREEDFASF